MYILLDRSNNGFKVLDTSDNAVEFFTIEQLKSLYLQDSSLVIYGLSNLNLIANTPIYTVLRLYDKNNVAHDFDGYTLTDACPNYDIMRYQILDAYNEPEVMNDIELFSSLYDILQRINRNLYDCTKEIYWINRPIVFALFCCWSKLREQHSIQTRQHRHWN